MTVQTKTKPTTTTTAKLTAFMYIRVSTPSQEVDEQVRMIRQYAAEHGIEIIMQYGDYQKRHKADQRRSFQAMLQDIETLKPNMILVQRLDRFGTTGPNQLGEFLEKLKKLKVKLVTVIDGMNRSSEDMATVIQNMIAAVQSKQEQIDKADRVLFGKRRRAVLGEYVGGKYLVYGFDVVCVGRDDQEKWRMVEDAWDCRIKYIANDKGEYVEVERYGNEIIKEANGIMPDKEIRHRPAKDTSDRLFYSPSIRQERVDTLRRICEWFDAGWTTYRMADQLNEEGIKPVYSKKGWYSAFIEWWNEVYAEVELLRQKQATVKQAIEQGCYIQKAEAIRRLIDHIECHFTNEPTTDGRYKSGFKAVCRSVTIHSKATAKATDGQSIPTMTIETPSA